MRTSNLQLSVNCKHRGKLKLLSIHMVFLNSFQFRILRGEKYSAIVKKLSPDNFWNYFSKISVMSKDLAENKGRALARAETQCCPHRATQQ